MRSHWTNRTIARCMALLLAAAGLLVACDREEDSAAPTGVATEMHLDAAQNDEGTETNPLVPATVELSAPLVCGPFTVYDQEDVETLCSPTTLAATPITSPNCLQPVSGSVRLEVDLICTDVSGLIVVDDNTVIDLNGHQIICRGGGYRTSCQGPGDPTSPFDDHGIDTNNRDNVHIFSHVPGGTIDGFDGGVFIRQDSENIKVKQVTITGPEETPGVPRPLTMGIFVLNNVGCDGAPIRIGGGTNTGNDVSHHTRGIDVSQSACVYVGYNQVHDNGGSGPGVGNYGILIRSSSNNHVRSNVVTTNGDGDRNLDAGLRISDPPTTGNLVVENRVNENDPYGVETRIGASGNYIVNNQMLFNTQFDAFSDQTSASLNDWNENNRCLTQTMPEPPPGVCSPDDVPPPQ